jgi:hypothetical protein
MSSLLDRAAGSLAKSDYESASAPERLDTRQTPAHNAQYVQRVIHKRAIADLLGAQRGLCRNQIGLSSDVTDRQHQTVCDGLLSKSFLPLSQQTRGSAQF